MKKHLFIYTLIILLTGCKKEWLDAKPDDSLVVPNKIADYQALLDNSNGLFNAGQPAIGEIASNEFYLLTTTWQALFTPIEQDCYTWTEDGSYSSGIADDWNSPYNQVLNSNIVLDGIPKLDESPSEVDAFNNVKGSALFFRAFANFELAQVFCKQYVASTATSDLGIPLRLSSDINEKPVRSTVQQTYDQIISDLVSSSNLLPDLPLYKTRPSRAAVFAMLSRVYLTMQEYDKCRQYADSCLKIQNSLMNYNSDPSVVPFALNPFLRFNDEVIFHSTRLNYSVFSTSRHIADSSLYNLYDSTDLRQQLYFVLNAGYMRYRGSYDGTRLLFGGLSVDEVYLNRAESSVRLGDVAQGVADLDTLRANRFKTGSFVPTSISNQQDALSLILTERRRELCFRGIRWSDLRRLNLESDKQETLHRVLDNQEFTLPPNDLRYVFPIPAQEILLSGIQQNPQ